MTLACCCRFAIRSANCASLNSSARTIPGAIDRVVAKCADRLSCSAKNSRRRSRTSIVGSSAVDSGSSLGSTRVPSGSANSSPSVPAGSPLFSSICRYFVSTDPSSRMVPYCDFFGIWPDNRFCISQNPANSTGSRFCVVRRAIAYAATKSFRFAVHPICPEASRNSNTPIHEPNVRVIAVASAESSTMIDEYDPTRRIAVSSVSHACASRSVCVPSMMLRIAAGTGKVRASDVARCRLNACSTISMSKSSSARKYITINPSDSLRS